MYPFWVAWTAVFFVFVWLCTSKILSKEKGFLIFEMLIFAFGVLTIVTLIYSQDETIINRPDETLIVIFINWICLFWMYKLFKIKEGFEFRITIATLRFIKSKLIRIYKFIVRH